MALQLLNLLEVLHTQGLIHGCISPQNICLDAQRSFAQLHLADFTMSR